MSSKTNLVQLLYTCLSENIAEFNVYCIVHKEIEAEPPCKRLFGELISAAKIRQRLILLENKAEKVFVVGLLVQEYLCYLREPEISSPSFDFAEQKGCRLKVAKEPIILVCIDKLDTTGLGIVSENKKTASLPRKIVRTYIDYLYLSHANRKMMIYVFSRPQPQYLFAESISNKNKKVLNDIALLKWWLITLSDTAFKISVLWDRFWHVPNSSHLLFYDLVNKFKELSIEWTYNLPFNGCEKAVDVIPIFKDDVKGRLLKCTEYENTKLADFKEVLGFTEECGTGKRVGLFYLKKTDVYTNVDSLTELEEVNMVDEETFINLKNILCDNFFDSENAVKSTKLVTEYLNGLKLALVQPTVTRFEVNNRYNIATTNKGEAHVLMVRKKPKIK